MVEVPEVKGAVNNARFRLENVGFILDSIKYRTSHTNDLVLDLLFKGKSIEQAMEDLKPMIPEGVYTTRSVCALAESKGVDMPISRAVANILFNNTPPAKAVHELMTRDAKAE